jgi:hypothetical protein
MIYTTRTLIALMATGPLTAMEKHAMTHHKDAVNLPITDFTEQTLAAHTFRTKNQGVEL